MTPKKLLTYVTTEDGCPFDEWLDGHKDNKAIRQIQKHLILVELGNLGDYKSFSGGVWSIGLTTRKGE